MRYTRARRSGRATTQIPRIHCPLSSTVEHSAVNRVVLGSNPREGATKENLMENKITSKLNLKFPQISKTLSSSTHNGYLVNYFYENSCEFLYIPVVENKITGDLLPLIYEPGFVYPEKPLFILIDFLENGY